MAIEESDKTTDWVDIGTYCEIKMKLNAIEYTFRCLDKLDLFSGVAKIQEKIKTRSAQHVFCLFVQCSCCILLQFVYEYLDLSSF